MAKPLIDQSTAAALVEGRHDDPFSVLGLHLRAGKWVVLAFDPGAEALVVLAGGKEIKAQALGHGLFGAELSAQMPYRSANCR